MTSLIEEFAKGMVGVAVGLVVLAELEKAVIAADIEDFMKHQMVDQSRQVHYN